MKEQYLYYFKKTRKQRSMLFIRMAAMFLFYVGVLFWVKEKEIFKLPEDTHQIMMWAFSGLSVVLLYVAWWHIKNPATFEAYITNDKFFVSYPGVTNWSFDVYNKDILRLEVRQSHSGAGKSLSRTGLVMENGDFHELCMNYGNSIRQMHKALKTKYPEVSFTSRVKTKYSV